MSPYCCSECDLSLIHIYELEDFMGEDDAEDTLRAVISLARYAEAFAYNDETATFSLENPV